MKAEYQRENEEMLDTIRQLSREVKLQTLVIDSCIPKDYQELLERNASWHEDTGEWHMVRRKVVHFVMVIVIYCTHREFIGIVFMFTAWNCLCWQQYAKTA